jgi:hypothetical protein
VARHLFGPHLSPALRNIFLWCGALIPPLWTLANRRVHLRKDMPMPSGALATTQSCQEALALIGREIQRGRIENAKLMGEYQEAVRELATQLSQSG